MKQYIFAVGFVVLLAGLWQVEAADEKMTMGDVCCKVLGKSGKITFLKAVEEKPGNKSGNASQANAKEKPCEAKKKITAEMDALSELDKDGNAIGTSGSKKHSFNTFASQDFTFGSTEPVSYGSQNISAQKLTFSAKINDADFNVHIYIFNEAGNITNGDEVTEVKKGTMKFNIEIKNWAFCGDAGVSCKKGQTVETGTQIEFTLTMKGTKEKPEKKADKGSKKGVEVSMGDGDEVILSKWVKVDGNDTKMSGDYPKIVEKGGKTSFVFRFPKGKDILYDPAVEMSSEASSSPDATTPAPGAPTTPSAATALVSSSLFLIFASLVVGLV